MVNVQLDEIVQFIVRNNAQIIGILVAGIVLVVLFLAYRSFLGAKAAELSPTQSVGTSFAGLEESLKKILEQAGALPAAAGHAGGGSSEALLTEIADLKKNLEEKQAEIEMAKTTQISNSAGGLEAAASHKGGFDALEAQIKELQAKLAEYEIISEDIADLSFYKEENAKLKKMVEQGGGTPTSGPVPQVIERSAGPSPAITQAPTPEVAAAAAPVVKPDEIPPAAAPSVPITAAEPAPPELSAQATKTLDEDLLKEFSMAVEEQAEHHPPPASAPAPVGKPEAPPGPAPETSSPLVAANLAVVTPPTTEGDGLGEMNLEKMFAEANDLQDLKNAAAPNALEAKVDEHKLLEEAISMEAVKPDDVKLMSDFENFKKEKG